MNQRIWSLRVELTDSDPLIWRRIHVSPETSLADFHGILQKVMGWKNCHLYEFRIEGIRINGPTGDEDSDDVQSIKLGAVGSVGANFTYFYDPGDGWFHKLIIEDEVPFDISKKYPVCVAGENACPPEDCGGIDGYYQLLKRRRSIDPTKFDLKSHQP